MPEFMNKSRSGKPVESGLNLLDFALSFGLVSGAAVVTALGKFLLGGLLGVLALGVYARMRRRAKRKADEAPRA